MRKFLLIIVLLISFCFGSSKVYADNELIYDIREMIISDNYITIKGWALIKNVHNNYPNNNSVIILRVITLDGRTVSEVKISELSQKNNKINDYDVSNKLDDSLYEALCLKVNASVDESIPCTVPYDQSGVEESPYNCSETGENCRYDYTGFEAKFELEEIFSKARNKNISFEIEVSVGDKREKASLAVHQANFKDNNTESKYSVDQIYMSNKFKILVNNARVLSGTSVAHKHGGTFYWTYGMEYEIDGSGYFPTNLRYEGIRMYRVKFGGISDVECQQNTELSGNALEGINCIGYAFSTWGRVDGNIVLNVSDPPELVCDVWENSSLQCENKNYASSCNYDINAGTVYAEGYDGCGGGYGVVKAKVQITQNGNLQFSLPITNIYAGGGFQYNVLYNNVAKWDYTSNGYYGCPWIIVGIERSYYDEEAEETKYYCGITTRMSDDCNNNSQYESFINSAVFQKYKGLNSSHISSEFPDSNVVDRINTDVGDWECTNNSVGTSWRPNSSISQTCTFTLYDAYIDKKTSNIIYSNVLLNDYLYGNSENGEPLYYVPLKMPSGQFYVKTNLTGLSSVSGMNWSANYICDVECQQKLYDLENGGYLYYFRPIALNNPFPNGRIPGVNWINWISSTQNKERLLKTYTDTNNIEYTVTLTNTDLANIKVYNQNKLYGGGRGYLDYSIDNNGNSEFIRAYDMFRNGNINHSALGVYNAGDDVQ